MLTAAPASFTLQQAALKANELVQSVPNVPDGILEPLAAAEILVARPGSGAWGLSVARGGAGDDLEGNGGYLQTSLGSLASIGAALPPPTTYVPLDIVVVIDPDQLTVHFARVSEVQP